MRYQPPANRIVVPLLMLAASLLLGGCRSASSPPPELSDAQITQLDKLFSVATKFQQELEKVVAQAKYPDEGEKAAAKATVDEHTVSYHLLRLKYLAVKRYRRRDDLAHFFEAAFVVPAGSQQPVAISPTQFRKQGQTAPYGDVSRLQALQNEFRVMGIALLSDIQ